jgi:uncharacterized SAM-binding protein YcdF (DUF218 family)
MFKEQDTYETYENIFFLNYVIRTLKPHHVLK